MARAGEGRPHGKAKSRKAVHATMGIRFRCPNGHKLNVKTFLAGKRGVCPDCGQTFRIPPEGTDDSSVVAMPLESRRNGSPRTEEDNLAESDFETAVAVAAAAVSEPAKAAVEGVVFLPPKPARSVPTPLASPVPAGQSPAPLALAPQTRAPQAPAAQSPAPHSPVPEIFFPSLVPKPAPQPVVPRPVPAVAPLPPRAPVDPIAEAPEARWYVRPPSGGEYGPARGDVMRKWIAEGRVSSDSLVWREDWTDWREAGPQFGPLATPAAASPAPTTPTALPGAAAPISARVAAGSPRNLAERKPVGRKRGNDMAVAALVCLVLVCVILVTVLVVVLSQGSA